MHIECFSPEGEPVFNIQVGAQIVGIANSAYPQKSFAFFARSMYGKSEIRNVRRGESAADALRYFGYQAAELARGIENALSVLVEQDQLDMPKASSLLESYRLSLRGYTYLNR